ncbi:MAG: oligoendopeptidase F [Clostridiales bacterium]|nr:oligoendopeptidase F [Clostridiales bacterium]
MTFENRKDIPVEYTWDLTAIYADEKAFNKEYDLAKELIEKVPQYKGRLNDKATILEGYKLLTAICKPLSRLGCYASLKNAEDSKNTHAQALLEKVMGLNVVFGEVSSFVEPEITALPEDMIDDMMADPDFGDYTVSLRRIKAGKAHVLSEKEEEMLNGMSDVTRFFRETFSRLNNGDLDFGTIEIDGKPVHITHGTYSALMNDKRQDVREAAFNSLYTAYKGMINTITGLYTGNVKNDCTVAKLRHFDSASQKALFYEEVDKKVYDNLIEGVNANLKPLHDYMALRKKVLKLENLNMYDLHFPMFENADICLEFDDAFKLVKEGLHPLGKDYQDLLQRAYDERWIDVYENAGKRSGAFSMGVPGRHPFVMLNYQKTVHDVFTIAHELGHSLHSWFSDQNQPFDKADYTIFVAEVASTTNEVLLLNYLLKTEKDENIRKFLMSYYLDMIRTTFYRQSMFAEFEDVAHNMVETGKPFNYQTLSDEYYALNKKYYGDAVTHNDFIRYEWARIPHFYTSFYVYKYATGITCAVNIAKRILSEGEPAVRDYKKFLSTGCSLDPVSELKIAGVDLTQTKPFEVIADDFKKYLAELTELCK